ncbi:MAG TPA: hypothetical protein VMV63_05550 [Acidithiobacillus sp.]|nr:hypothetical protein [Acidithiobacillus sp.]
MNTYHEIQKIKKQGAVLRYAVISITAAGILGTVFMAGGQEGYGYAIHKIKAAVQASQYPTVKEVWPSREAIAIIRGNVCYPLIPGAKLPTFYKVEWVSPMDRRCGPGKPGQPYQDSAALAAITKEVQK